MPRVFITADLLKTKSIVVKLKMVKRKYFISVLLTGE